MKFFRVSDRKGIILAAGKGTRLYPVTSSLNKHLIPVCDKPMIYYPLSTLMLCGVRDILIITTKSSINLFKQLLGDGCQWGINIKYKVQEKSEGVAHAISLGEEFVGDKEVVAILGDNIFHGSDLVSFLRAADSASEGATVFAYPVKDPRRYGVVNFDDNGNVMNLEEKPSDFKSKYAITGLYFFDNSIFNRIRALNYSSRNEIEITSLNSSYLRDGLLKIEIMSRGMAWFDAGTFDSLKDTSTYISSLQLRQGLKVGCPEEISWRQGWIDDYQLVKLADQLISSGYGDYLFGLLEGK